MKKPSGSDEERIRREGKLKISALEGLYQQARNKGVRFWITTFLIVLCGTWFGSWLDRQPVALHERSKFTQRIIETGPFVRKSRSVTAIIIEIDDQTYYGSENRGLSPVSPRVIAKLMMRLRQAGAAIAVLDLDMSDPDPGHPGLLGDEFGMQADELWQTILNVSPDMGVILAVTLTQDGTGINRSYLGDFTQMQLPNSVRIGVANLPKEILRLPRTHLVSHAGYVVDSLACATARFRLSSECVDSMSPPNSDAPVIAMLRPEAFPRMTAEELMNGDPSIVHHSVNGRVAFVGGVWNTLIRTSGMPVDSYETPVGLLHGVEIHANFFEAITTGRLYEPASSSLVMLLKFTFVLLVSGIISFCHRPILKTALVAASLFLYLLVSYFLFVNGGLSFDVLVPFVLIMCHAIFDQVLDWRRNAHSRSI